MDGSQKIPQRWLNSLNALIARQENCDVFYFALASWMRYCLGEDEQGQPIDISDPLAENYRNLAAQYSNNTEQYVRKFLELEAVFDKKHSQNHTIVQGVTRYLNLMNERGIKLALQQLTGDSV